MTLACLTGLLLLGFISTFLFVTTIGAVAALGDKQPQMPSSAVLYLDMSTIMLTEQTQEPDPLSILQGDGTEVQPLGIYSAIRTINTAAEDPAVKFIYMKPDGVMGGLAQIEEFPQQRQGHHFIHGNAYQCGLLPRFRIRQDLHDLTRWGHQPADGRIFTDDIPEGPA